MFLLIFLPVLFTVLGGLIGYLIARAQGMKGRAVWAQVAGGAFGGLLGGLLTVPFLGIAGTVTAAVAATAPAGTAGIIGTGVEWTALGLGQAAGTVAGQAATNEVNGDPLTKDLAPAGMIGFASQLVLAPVGDKAVVALLPLVPAASRAILAAISKASRVALDRLAGETTTEALTDGATMVVPMPGGDKKGERAPPGPVTAPSQAQSPGIVKALNQTTAQTARPVRAN